MGKSKEKLVIGILAHVDAGKTTLAEGILYLQGKLRKLGRVDHKDAFLDTYAQERERGITIFSKQALVTLDNREVTLLDTPGHVDFSAEMERTLQILDAAILVISGADGIQGHVETLWRLLRRYHVPVFLFLNKMDQPGTDPEKLISELKERLDDHVVDFMPGQDRERYLDNIAVCRETLMETYLETGELYDQEIAAAIMDREIFPCYFGSALKLSGVEELLHGVSVYAKAKPGGDEFAARVFKISRDSQGNRLTHIKITGGQLKVKSLINGEKVDQLRLYSGNAYELADCVTKGSVCAVTGLKETFCGQGLGCEAEGMLPLLEPVLTYRVAMPAECDIHKILGQLKQLEEEIPELHIVWKEAVGEIHIQVMGEVQIEILTSLIKERFDVEVQFSAGSIVYKETIAETVEGIGHYEPLRHYAEVHLLLEPAERGTGLQFISDCSEDILDRNWQRLILTHLEERQHPGVLIGAEITDMRITLINGRAHQKHTEGGDLRQATYRAVRQGLRKAACILLEPVYAYTLEVPTETVGRAMTDIQKMCGSFEPPISQGQMSILKGKAPVVTMQGYQTQVYAYTKGRGRLSCILQGYEPCHNGSRIVEQAAYDPERDQENPTGSVFCAHGAGYAVPWNQVDEYAHIEPLTLDQMPGQAKRGGEASREITGQGFHRMPNIEDMGTKGNRTDYVTQEELEEIFERTYGTKERERNRYNRNKPVERVVVSPEYKPKPKAKQEEYLLVDGYNIIFAWEELRTLSQINIDSARDKLMDALCNYQGYKNCTLILVFDAYKVKGNPGSVMKYHNIYVVYTKEAETADQYIEKTVHEIAHKYQVTVATSDALEQMIIWGQGAARMSALGLKEEVEKASREIRETWQEKLPGEKYRPFQQLFGKE